jgi:CheY-like chemotaxis protein
VIGIYSKEVLIVRMGIEAVKACRNNPTIDVVLMDIKIPAIYGYDATRQIGQFNKNLVIIEQTADAITGEKEMEIEEGCNDYISKPIKKDEFLAIIISISKIRLGKFSYLSYGDKCKRDVKSC